MKESQGEILPPAVYAEEYLSIHGPETMAELIAQRNVERSARQLAELEARTDALTGLPNRRALNEHLKTLEARGTTDYAIGIVDIDRFKQVNDKEGHVIGDEILAKISEILRTRFKSNDLVARTGGDEFMLVLHRLSVDDFANTAASVRARVLAYLEDKLGFTTKHGLSMSIGIVHRSTNTSVAEAIAAADAAMYADKQRRDTPPEYTI